jgi:ubiquinone/menaquinone biosynthesis C-methylase UbiE
MARDVARIYDRLGAGYDRLARLLDTTGVNRLRADLLARAHGDVLEVAVGSGVNLRRYPAGVRVVGLDLSTKALVAARSRAAEAALDFTAVRGDAAALPVPDASVDTVVCTLAGCVFPDPAAVFTEVRRVLRPAGRVLLLEHVRPRSPLGLAAVRVVKPVTTRVLGCHPDRPTVATVEAAGFTTTVLATTGPFVEFEAVPAALTSAPPR